MYTHIILTQRDKCIHDYIHTTCIHTHTHTHTLSYTHTHKTKMHDSTPLITDLFPELHSYPIKLNSGSPACTRSIFASLLSAQLTNFNCKLLLLASPSLLYAIDPAVTSLHGLCI